MNETTGKNFDHTYWHSSRETNSIQSFDGLASLLSSSSWEAIEPIDFCLLLSGVANHTSKFFHDNFYT
jgi:hypothetical protein